MLNSGIFKPRKLSLDFINEKYDLNDEFESLDISDDLSEAQNGCIEYLSGFLVRKLKSSTKCNICLNTMLPSTENENCKSFPYSAKRPRWTYLSVERFSKSL